MPHIYNQDHVAFVREHYSEKGDSAKSATEVAKLLNEKFGTKATKNTVYNLAQKYGFRCSMPAGRFCKGKRKSPSTEFKKGRTPWNKGRKGLCYPGSVATQFKKGHRTHNYRLIGSEAVRADGFVWVKVAEPNVSREKHRIVWEQHYGQSIPKGHVVIFADRNRQNCDLDNLILVTRRELLILNRRGLISTNADATRAALALVKLTVAVNDRKKGANGCGSKGRTEE